MSMENSTRVQVMMIDQTHQLSHLNPPQGNTNVSLHGGGGGGLVHNSAANGGGIAMEIPVTPLTPKSISRSEPNPYPTTFVQADTSNFKHVVQMLTGSSETVTKHQQQQQQQFKQQVHRSDPSLSGLPGPTTSKSMIPPIRAPPKRSQQQQQQRGFNLYERRNHSHLKNSLIINTVVPGGLGFAGGFSPRNKHEILSPSKLDFPNLTLSPVTPLVDPFNSSSSGSGSGSSPSLGSSSSSSSEEERAIAEKGFYLHPSPVNTPRGAEPQLLPLFPVTSPRVSGASP